MINSQISRYAGDEIEVFWDGRLCIHIGECGQAKGDLFVGGRDPWCLPDCTGKAEVRDVVERCPSGALTYADRAGTPEQAPATNRVAVTYNGPLFASGDLWIEGAPADMPGVRLRAALCRCGQSRNKPFCDNSHESARFRDSGAIGETGPGAGGTGGRLSIKPLTDGPLLLSGHVVLQAGSGREAWHGEQVALCRCGESKNKPFCDGSHKAAGFKSG